jgi:hypothetical protein
MKDVYEDAIYEGWRLQEGRENGREAARQAKARTTRRTRDAIKAAALDLYKSNPNLVRNDAATARAIEVMRLPDLCRNGQPIGSSVGGVSSHHLLRAKTCASDWRKASFWPHPK